MNRKDLGIAHEPTEYETPFGTPENPKPNPTPLTEEEQQERLKSLLEGSKQDHPDLVEQAIRLARRLSEMVGGKVTSDNDDDIDWDKENEDE